MHYELLTVIFSFITCNYIILLNQNKTPPNLPHVELLVNDPGLLYDPVYLWMETGHHGGRISV